MNCVLGSTSVVPSLSFVDFVRGASGVCLGRGAGALVWRWGRACPLGVGVFALGAPISAGGVSVFGLALEVCFGGHFGLIRAVFLSLGSARSGCFFLGHPVYNSL